MRNYLAALSRYPNPSTLALSETFPILLTLIGHIKGYYIFVLSFCSLSAAEAWFWLLLAKGADDDEIL